LLIGLLLRIVADLAAVDVGPVLDVGGYGKNFIVGLILLRGGFVLKDFRRSNVGTILPGIAALVVEILTILTLLKLVFDWDWNASFFAAFLLSAVSPSIAIPTALEYAGTSREEELEMRGMLKTTLAQIVVLWVLVDNVIVVVGLDIMAYPGALDIPRIGLSILFSIGLGGIVGYGASFLRGSPWLGAMLVLAVCWFIVTFGPQIGLMIIITIGAISVVFSKQRFGQDGEEERPFEQLWSFLAPAFFVYIAFEVEVLGLWESLAMGLLLIPAGSAARFGLLALLGDRIQPGLARARFWMMPKATIQAGFGGLALTAGIAHGAEIQALAVMAIVMMAPMGSAAIYRFGFRSR
jgi:Kef-type K+ transport system membrane component KefB